MTATAHEWESQKIQLFQRASAAEARSRQCLINAEAHAAAAQSGGSKHHLRLTEIYRRIADAHQTSANAHRQAVTVMQTTSTRATRLSNF
ncbi:hypothetical protein ABZ930_32055 [Streptomyces sp. NPDC046716]|uniref:hypothetical protein n=1 Tax=Streptomyces sp. NPDC046716 TaxID=3157093 RepID=UPI0033EF3BDE